MNTRSLSAMTVFALVCMCTTAFAMDVHELTMTGSTLKAKEAESLEKRIERNPHDVVSRTRLLGYYFGRQFQDQSDRARRQKHIVWLVINAPKSDVLGMPEGQLDADLDAEAYSQAKKAWIDHIRKKPKIKSIILA